LTLVLSAAVARADHRHRRNRPADFAVGHRHGAGTTGRLPVSRSPALLRQPVDRQRFTRGDRPGAATARFAHTTLVTYSHLWPDSTSPHEPLSGSVRGSCTVRT